MLRESDLTLTPGADTSERNRALRGFDPRDPSFLADPYPTYARLLRDEPVTHTSLGWFVVRYEDAATVLSDSRLGHPDHSAGKLLNWWLGPIGRLRRNIVITRNPDFDHPDVTAASSLQEAPVRWNRASCDPSRCNDPSSAF